MEDLSRLALKHHRASQVRGFVLSKSFVIYDLHYRLTSAIGLAPPATCKPPAWLQRSAGTPLARHFWMPIDAVEPDLEVYLCDPTGKGFEFDHRRTVPSSLPPVSEAPLGQLVIWQHEY
jgi:hypothetical protein